MEKSVAPPAAVHHCTITTQPTCPPTDGTDTVTNEVIGLEPYCTILFQSPNYPANYDTGPYTCIFKFRVLIKQLRICVNKAGVAWYIGNIQDFHSGGPGSEPRHTPFLEQEWLNEGKC